MKAGGSRLSVRDQTKPLILIASMGAGLIVNRLTGGLSALIYVVRIGVFLVIFAVMLPVEIKQLSGTFRKVKPMAKTAVMIAMIWPPQALPMAAPTSRTVKV